MHSKNQKNKLLNKTSISNKSIFYVVGVMSGTSLDGIDLCYVRFEQAESWKFKVIDAKTVDYPKEWQELLQNAISYSPSKLAQINKDYTYFLSKVISDFIKQYPEPTIDAICSHGHTIYHQPNLGRTLQIGNLPILSNYLNQMVVCDFRTQDIRLGGQGAPLVPIGDALLFPQYDYCINLGGFANISYRKNLERIAFDICPVNIIMNHYTKTIGLPYDSEGNVALKGTICFPLLDELNSLNFYASPYPKSLGLEWVQENIYPIIDSYELSVYCILRTVVEHCAFQISNVIKGSNLKNGLFTGGGVYNTFLINRIQSLSNHEIVKASAEIIEFKEALIFGFLGVLKLKEIPNCLSSVTGASYDHSSGCVYFPKNNINST